MAKKVIEISNLGKQYRLGQVGTTTMADDLKRWWYNVQGKEDPFLKVGEENDRTKKSDSDYVWALKDINFDVYQGDVLGIIGKNGAGKSTLLKILSRTTSPSTGEYKIKGRVASLLEVGTGFHPDLTGRENVFLNGAILGMTKSEIKKHFDEIIDFSGVERYIDTPVKRYSSGMYVRLAFAVAAHLNPEILIVDEVLAVGDLEFQKKCLNKMKTVSGQGKTVLFVSHNMSAIRNLCTSALLLRNGTILSSGKIDVVLSDYLMDSGNYNSMYEQQENKIKDVHLRKIILFNEDYSPVSTFSFESNIILRIDYDINKAVDSLSVWFAVRTLDEQIIFASTDNDTTPELLNLRQPGCYSSEIIIPKKLLNTGNFRLVIGINRISGSAEMYDRVDQILFNVEDLSIYHSKEIAERTGIIKPFLKWHQTFRS